MKRTQALLFRFQFLEVSMLLYVVIQCSFHDVVLVEETCQVHLEPLSAS